jgi:hypothetical protein
MGSNILYQSSQRDYATVSDPVGTTLHSAQDSSSESQGVEIKTQSNSPIQYYRNTAASQLDDFFGSICGVHVLQEHSTLPEIENSVNTMNKFILGRKPKEAHKMNQRLRRSKRLQEKNQKRAEGNSAHESPAYYQCWERKLKRRARSVMGLHHVAWDSQPKSD